MYARIAVASNALDLGTVPAPIANALHGALVEALLAHGRLVFGSQEEAFEFLRAVRETGGVPPGARTRWNAALVQLRQSRRVVLADQPCQTSLASVSTLDALREQWGEEADIAVIADAACPSLGVPMDTGILSDPNINPDLAVPAAAPSAPALSRVQELEQRPVAPYDSPREEFWDTVLQPLATNAVTATILDGYLFKLLSKIANGGLPTPPGGEHVTWLLAHLDNVMADGATVRLIANAVNVEPGDDAKALATALRDQWKPPSVGRLARIEVFLGKGNYQRPFPHDRHIRFSTGGAIKVTAGFDRLREDRIWDRSGMWWSYHWRKSALDDLRADESAAEALTRHRATFDLRP
jgi:hypothetical protein